MWRREIELVARLLAVSSKSLQDNPHISTAVVFLKVRQRRFIRVHSASFQLLKLIYGKPLSAIRA